MSWNRFLVQAVLVGTTAAASAAWVEPAAAAEDTAAEGAAAGPKRVVIALTGPQSKKVRGYLVKELDGDVVNVVPEKEAKKIGPKTENEELVAFATENDVSAFVLGRVILKKGVAWILEVEVLNGADGERIEERTTRAASVPGLGKKISGDLALEIGEALADSKSPAALIAEQEAAKQAEEEAAEAEGAEAELEEDAPPEEEEEEPDAPPSGRPSPLEVGAGLKFFTRNLSYEDNLSENLLGYELGGAPAAFIQLAWYPLAHVSGGVPANFGIIGSYEHAFALTSTGPNNEDIDTSSNQWFAGLRFRIPMNAHEIGLSAAYGNHSFEVAASGVPLVPNVSYSFVRAMLDARFRFGKILVGVNVGPRFLLDPGDGIKDPAYFFPSTSGLGFEAGLMLGYALSPSLDLVAGGELRRYGLSFNQTAAEVDAQATPTVAAGAVDQFLAGHLGLLFRIPGDE